MDNAVKPAQPHLEVANAAPPVRVNQDASQRFAQTFPWWHRAEPERQRDRDVPGQRSVGGNLRASNAPDLLFH